MSRIPSQRIDSLESPGLAVYPVALGPNDASLAKLLIALDLTGDAAGNLAAVDRQEKARIAAEDAKATEFDKGRARLDAATYFQQKQTDIQADKLQPLSYDDLEGSTDAMLAPQIEGQSEAYQRQYRESVQPAFVGAFADQRQRFRDRAVASATEHIAANVQDATTVDDLATQESAFLLLDSRHTREGFLTKLVTPALRNAAAVGDEEAFNVFADVLAKAKVDTAEIEIGRQNLKAAQHRQEAEVVDGFQNDVAGARLNGQSFDAVRSLAKSYRGKVPDEVIQQSIEHLDAQERSAISESRTGALKAELAQHQADYNADVDAAVGAGLGFMVEDRKVTLSNLDEKSLDAGDALRGSMDRQFQRIAASTPDPEQAFARQADLASRNGYQPPQWKRTLAAGAMAATETALAPEGKETPLPPAAVAGYGLYKRLKAQSPQLLESMVTDEKARDLYEVATVLQEDSTSPDDQTAMLGARRILSGPGGGPLGDTKESELKSAAAGITDRWFAGDAKNGGEIAADISRRARVFIRAGMSPDDAVSRVAKQIGDSRIIINGWAVSTGDAALPDSVRAKLPEFSTDIIAKWAKAHGEEEGLEEGDLTLRPSPTTGFWMLADGRTGLPVRNFGDSSEMMFAPSDLIRMAQAKQAEADQKIIDAQNNPEPSLLERGMGGIGKYTSGDKGQPEPYKEGDPMFKREGEGYTFHPKTPSLERDKGGHTLKWRRKEKPKE